MLARIHFQCRFGGGLHIVAPSAGFRRQTSAALLMSDPKAPEKYKARMFRKLSTR
jgi:hypothetical protein